MKMMETDVNFGFAFKKLESSNFTLKIYVDVAFIYNRDLLSQLCSSTAVINY